MTRLMPVVSNTSPILNLAIINHLTLLRDQFNTIAIPPSVLEELRLGEELPGEVPIAAAIDGGWIKVEEVRDHTLVQVLKRDLDQGEAEAIALAVEMKVEWTLLDERDGRQIAKSLGLQVSGTIGILLKAKRNGQLASMQVVLDELQQKAGFYIGDKLLELLMSVK